MHYALSLRGDIKMANEKTVVWYRPGKPVKAVRVELSLANMQKLVGGKIQIVPLEPKGSSPEYTLICNEDGKNKYHNDALFPLLNNNGNIIDVIFGPCFIAGKLMNDENGEETFIDLFREDYLRIVRRFGKGAVKNERKETEAADFKQLTACRNMLARLRARKNGKCSLSDG